MHVGGSWLKSYERLEHMHIQGFMEMGLLYRQTTVPDFPSFPLQKEHVLLNLMVFPYLVEIETA